MKWSLKPGKLELVVCAIILLGLLVLFGPGSRIDYYSCHKCRNTKEAHAHTFLFWRWPKGEEISTEHPVEQGHTHEWWRYATSKWGLTPSASSRADMYKDGWRPSSRAEEAAPSTATAPASAEGPAR